jgi:hypothetical protein
MRRVTSMLAAVMVTVSLVACGGDGGTATPDIAGVEVIHIGDYKHLTHGTKVTYDRHPPAGGDHYFSPFWMSCGFYTETVPDVLAVHSLEHGAVWIAFSETLPTDQVETIRSITKANKVVAAPYQGLDSPVVVTAWGVQLRLESASDARLEAFVTKYVDASTAPEQHAMCARGEGGPAPSS